MQKYKFYFEMEGKNGEKVNKRTKKNGFIYREQLTSERRTADWRKEEQWAVRAKQRTKTSLLGF